MEFVQSQGGGRSPYHRVKSSSKLEIFKSEYECKISLPVLIGLLRKILFLTDSLLLDRHVIS